MNFPSTVQSYIPVGPDVKIFFYPYLPVVEGEGPVA
jgi:hypothetical protein